MSSCEVMMKLHEITGTSTVYDIRFQTCRVSKKQLD